jgi:hypothetical protein
MFQSISRQPHCSTELAANSISEVGYGRRSPTGTNYARNKLETTKMKTTSIETSTDSDQQIPTCALDAEHELQVGQEVRIDVAPATIEKEPREYLGTVLERWETRTGELQAIVHAMRPIDHAESASPARGFYDGALFITIPSLLRKGSVLQALGSADVNTRELIIEEENDCLSHLAYLDVMDALRGKN